jgi:hypothetical protein
MSGFFFLPHPPKADGSANAVAILCEYKRLPLGAAEIREFVGESILTMSGL